MTSTQMADGHAGGPLAAHKAGFVSLGNRRICRMGFGSMRLTGPGFWGPPADRPNALKVLRAAADLGVQLIDCADSYGPDVVEELIAEALWPYADELVVTTKAGYERSGPDRWKANARPEHLRAACEASLRRLRLERHPLYQLHCVDPDVPLAESLGALTRLQSEGKIEMIGLSNVSATQLAEGCELASIVSVQNCFNEADRSSAPILEQCERRGLVFMPYSPLRSGEIGTADRHATPGPAAAMTPAQAAIAWLLEQSPSTVPIPGTSSVDHLRENVAAAGFASAMHDVNTQGLM